MIERIAEPGGYSEEELHSLPPDDVPYHDIPQTNMIVPSAIIVSARKIRDSR